MKNLLMLFASILLMSSTGLAFDQADLDSIESVSELSEEAGFEALATADSAEVEEFMRGRRFRCVARNGRGARFVGKAPVRRRARRRAMRQCRRNSFRPHTCRMIRCGRRGGKLGQLIEIIEIFESL